MGQDTGTLAPALPAENGCHPCVMKPHAREKGDGYLTWHMTLIHFHLHGCLCLNDALLCYMCLSQCAQTMSLLVQQEVLFASSSVLLLLFWQEGGGGSLTKLQQVIGRPRLNGEFLPIQGLGWVGRSGAQKKKFVHPPPPLE